MSQSISYELVGLTSGNVDKPTLVASLNEAWESFQGTNLKPSDAAILGFDVTNPFTIEVTAAGAGGKKYEYVVKILLPAALVAAATQLGEDAVVMLKAIFEQLFENDIYPLLAIAVRDREREVGSLIKINKNTQSGNE